MKIVDETIISEDIFEKKFICDLDKCKGACCVEGDAGAPLEPEEVDIIAKYYDVFKAYMTEKGIEQVDNNGFYVRDDAGTILTPLIGQRECVYVYFDNGVAKCAIEKAYIEGLIKFKKPISCHLYPIRIIKLDTMEAVNYHDWDICKDACKKGKECNTSAFQFLKEPLIRKYGIEWYYELENMINKR